MSAPTPHPSALPQSVLVVEDQPETAELLRVLLEDFYTVTVARSFHAALDVADGRLFDLFLFDVQLPDGTGSDLLRELRRRPVYEAVPAVACTARPPSRVDAFDAYVGKPFEIGELLHVLDDLTHPPAPSNRA